MGKEKFLDRLINYFNNHYALKDGYFTDDDISFMKYFEFNKNYFSDYIKYYDIIYDRQFAFIEQLSFKVNEFLVNLGYLDDKFFYENRVYLDQVLPFKYDDLLVIKYILQGYNYNDFSSYINPFIYNGYVGNSKINVEQIKNKINTYYSSNEILSRSDYNFIFRRKLNELFLDDNINLEEEFNNIDYYNKERISNNKIIMGSFAEQHAYNFLKNYYPKIIWVSKVCGDGHGFDFLIPYIIREEKRGRLFEIKATTNYSEKIKDLLTANESDVFRKAMREDSCFDYFIYLYSVCVAESGRLSFPDYPQVFFYDRDNHEVYDSNDIPYKIIENSEGRIGLEDKLEKYKTMIYTK